MRRPRRLWAGLSVCALASMSGTRANDAPEIQAIDIIGLAHSRPALVLRELPFSRGDRWTPGMAAEAERRLRNLGLFRRVRVEGPDRDGRVRISLRERWSFWILPTVSRRDDGRSTVGVALDEFNLWGLGHHLRLAGKQDTGKNFSGGNGQVFEAGYHWARLRGSRLSLGLGYQGGQSLYVGFDRGRSVANYLEDRQAWSLGLDYALGPVPGEGWTTGLTLASNERRLSLLDGRPLPDLRDARIRLAGLSLGYRRIDDHITWLTGTTFGYRVTVATGALGSDLDYVQQTATLIHHRPLGHGDTIDLRLAAGRIDGDRLRNTLFDLGNRNTIRGYFPGELQATRYLFGTLEGRFLSHSGGNLQFVAFTDIGHLRNGDERPFDRSIITGLGAGLRWTLRWLVHGTLRVDMAYGLANRRWRLYLGTRQAF